MIGNGTNGIWRYDFPQQPNGTVIYFLVEAFDLENVLAFWPDNYPTFQYPSWITIEFPSKPYLSYVYFTLNSLTISDLLQQANVTINAAGYMPKIPEIWYVPVDVVSNGPRGSKFPLFSMQNQGTRFYYSGQASWWVDLKGSPNQLPYDTYTISLDVTIPYRFNNLSYVASTPVYLFSSADIWNSWIVPEPNVWWSIVGNTTVLRMESTLSRRIPTYYPPLVLMLVAFAVLGLIPLVSIYHHARRYDLFLNIIILASSAELSQTLTPAVGFQGDNIFLISFAAILGAVVFMMAASSLPEKVRMKKYRGFQLEFYTTILIVALAFLIVSNTNFPLVAKLLIPPLGGSGVIVLAFYETRKKTKYVIKRVSGKLSRWFGNHMSFHDRSESVARVVALVGLLGGAFQIYVYVNPDSSKLSAFAIYAWMIVAVLLALLAVAVAAPILPLKQNRRKRRP